MSEQELKLSKKEKKAAAFKKDKKAKKSSAEDDVLDVPEEDAPVPDSADEKELAQKGSTSKASIAKREAAKAAKEEKKKEKSAAKAPLKAAEKTAEKTEKAVKKDKKRKLEDVKDNDEPAGEKKDVSETPSAKRSKKSNTDSGSKDKAEAKFILFVGNLPFDITKDSLQKHFETCGEAPSVRLVTTKPKPGSKDLPKPKGCAFVEFKSAAPLQKALRFHHTLFEGRSLNVELSAGGGGNSTERIDKIKKRNVILDEERSKLHEKYHKDKPQPTEEEQGKVLNSSTSGAPMPKVWGNGADKGGSGGGRGRGGSSSRGRGGSSRGGSSRGGRDGSSRGGGGSRSGGSRGQSWNAASGANSMPLG